MATEHLPCGMAAEELESLHFICVVAVDLNLNLEMDTQFGYWKAWSTFGTTWVCESRVCVCVWVYFPNCKFHEIQTQIKYFLMQI